MIRRLAILICVLSAGKLMAAERNSLRVISQGLSKGDSKLALRMLWLPEDGGAITGTVVYPKGNRKACHAFGDTDDFRTKNPFALPIFLLVDRGDCFFTIKAMTSQNAGAVGILVVDDTFEEMPFTVDEIEDEEGEDRGNRITIPYALLIRSQGDKMKKALSEGQTVIVHLDWMEAPNNERPTHEFWTTSDDAMSGPKFNSQMTFLAVKPHKSLSMKTLRSRITAWPGYSKWPKADSAGFVGNYVIILHFAM